MAEQPGTSRDAADWAARRTAAAAEQAARLHRRQQAESTQARELLAAFVREATARGIPTVALQARAHNGRTLYRTGLTGWYLRRNGSLAVDVHGDFYLMNAPSSVAARWRGVTLTPADPPLVVGVGGRDGESMPLAELIERRLAAGANWPR